MKKEGITTIKPGIPEQDRKALQVGCGFVVAIVLFTLFIIFSRGL